MSNKKHELKIYRAKGKDLYHKATLARCEFPMRPPLALNRKKQYHWDITASECFPYHSKHCKDNSIGRYYSYIIAKVGRISSYKHSELHIILPPRCNIVKTTILNAAFEARNVDWRIFSRHVVGPNNSIPVLVAKPFDMEFMMMPPDKLQTLLQYPPTERPTVKLEKKKPWDW